MIKRLYWTIWSVTEKLGTAIKFVLLIINNLYAIPTHFAFLLLLSPLNLWNPQYYWAIESLLFDWISSSISLWISTSKVQVIEWNADQLDRVVANEDEKSIFMPNHQCTADVPLMIHLLTRRRAMRHVMWVMDSVFRWTNFGWISLAHNDFFINSGKSYRNRSVDDLAKHLKSVFVSRKRRHMILFPEGGFLYKRRLASQKYAKRHGLRQLSYCATPRTGAFRAAMKSMPNLTKIVDITIAYADSEKVPSIRDISCSSRGPNVIHVMYQVFDINELPKPDNEVCADYDAALDEWLNQLYYNKEDWLRSFYSSDSSKHIQTRRQCRQFMPNMTALWIVQAFYFMSFIALSYIFRHCFFFYSTKDVMSEINN